jgi:putative DNA primase/helicase
MSRPAEAGAPLLAAIADAVGRHVVLPARGAEMAALWTMHTHAHAAAQHSPLFGVESPDGACGKTTLLRVLAGLTPMPLTIVDVSPAGLYRMTTARKQTWLVDEANTSLGSNHLLRTLFKGGHCRENARIVRADGIYNAWAPKAMAFIGEIPPELRSRSLRIGLQRKLPHQTVAPLDPAALAHLQCLCERSAAWVAANFEQLVTANPILPPELANRFADNWRPLLAIADLAGGHWPDTARAIGVMTAGADPNASPGVALLTDIRRVFRAVESDRIPSVDLVAALAAMEERPWGEWNRGGPITPIQVAALLRPWRIAPKTIRFSAGSAKGYLVADFGDAFGRYL